MTVRYRCGQSNELPPVWIFYYLLMRDRSMGSCLSRADKVLPIEFGGGYYRKEKVAEIQYAIVYVKTTVEYEANQ